MYIFNRAGRCLYYKEWSRPHFALADDPDEDKKLMFGMLFSLKDLTNKMSPTGERTEGIHTINLETFTLHHFESLSGICIVLNTSHNVDDMYTELKHIYNNIYIECVTRSALYRTEPGKPITSAIFEKQLVAYLVTAVRRNTR